ncbi:Toll-Interleukin-Resistance domain family protein [Perilla frutescens var. hirtella]|nr:Toll-Interleukin-Resistance domain family protein [Perilla frutescens var. frutescens]KAH6775284.1 Toll-Interleukin-Resistance domain family protein [Perilla frutescens var. hirtella]
MQRTSSAAVSRRQLLRSRGGEPRLRSQEPPCEVFINHRGSDTKRNVSGLLYHHLRGLRLRPFLDSRSMKPGDKLFDKIDVAIRHCKVGVAVFSPTYCDSYFCLHELSLMVESGKKIVPIFCDVKPSELRVKGDGSWSDPDLEKFRSALEEAKCTVGVTFDTVKGDWPEFLVSAADAVIKNLIEVEEEEGIIGRNGRKI